MRALLQLLGLDVTSDGVRETLAGLGSFKPEMIDLAPDEGVPKDFYLSSKGAGVCIKHEASGEITTIFLMSEGRDGYSQFRGELGIALSFASTPADVRGILGSPSFERAASPRKGLLAHGTILRFDRPSNSIHFQFLPGDGGIELVTLMSPQVVPGRRA